MPRVQVLDPVCFRDERGEFVETWSEQSLPGYSWKRDNLSFSHQGVLRGIHGEPQTTKLVSCIRGKAYVVVVSPLRDSWASFELSGENRLRLLVPAGFGLAYYAMTDVIYSYKQDTHHSSAREFTWKWNDPELGIEWPDYNPILSARDK